VDALLLAGGIGKRSRARSNSGELRSGVRLVEVAEGSRAERTAAELAEMLKTLSEKKFDEGIRSETDPPCRRRRQ